MIRSVNASITEDRLREDLDHIHNLVIIDVSYQDGDCYIELNSIHNSLFARTCMMSRAGYKGLRIEWYADECAQPLLKTRYASEKESKSPRSPKKANAMANRFQMFDMDEGRTEDECEEDEKPTVLSSMSSLQVDPPNAWGRGIVIA